MPTQKPRTHNAVLHKGVIDGIDNPASPVILATDASNHPAAISMGWVSSTGQYGVKANKYPRSVSRQDRITVAELRAIEYALRHVRTCTDAPVHVLADSKSALSYLDKWANGTSPMPNGYSVARKAGKTPALLSLADRVRRMVAAGTLSWEHVHGHRGHPLNEGADSLAKLGLRTLLQRGDLRVVGDLALMRADRVLSEYVTTKTAA